MAPTSQDPGTHAIALRHPIRLRAAFRPKFARRQASRFCRTRVLAIGSDLAAILVFSRSTFERVIAKFGLWQDSCVFVAVAAIRESLAAAKYDCQSRLPFVRPAHVGTRRFVHPMQVRERAAGGGVARSRTRGSELRERLPGLARAGSTGAVCSALVCRISRVTHARERPRTRCSPRPGASWRPARRPA